MEILGTHLLAAKAKLEVGLMGILTAHPVRSFISALQAIIGSTSSHLSS